MILPKQCTGRVITLATFGYFKKHFLMTSREVAATRELILECAASNDRQLDTLYIDEIETAPYELHQCLQKAGASRDAVLIIPSLLHLAGEGDPRRLRQQLENHGLVVLIAQPQQAGRTC
ncbi:hypothetical protein ACFPJ1_19685 [Kribbella qitaiheensis]|uniref:hypothetical protein n=1 Tax=Kribbella qitaiheensis TaxID=1544730 RepID=UPI00361C6484